MLNYRAIIKHRNINCGTISIETMGNYFHWNNVELFSLKPCGLKIKALLRNQLTKSNKRMFLGQALQTIIHGVQRLILIQQPIQSGIACNTIWKKSFSNSQVINIKYSFFFFIFKCSLCKSISLYVQAPSRTW